MMTPKAFYALLVGICLISVIFPPSAPAENSPKLVLNASVRHDAQQEPGIVGLDLLITKREYPIVQTVFKGSPAYFKGIQPGDKIVEINGIATLGKNDREIDRMISDVPGTPVGLKIQRGFMTADVILTVASLSYVPKNVRNNYTSMTFNSYDAIP